MIRVRNNVSRVPPGTTGVFGTTGVPPVGLRYRPPGIDRRDACRTKDATHRGFTLVELLVVIGIIGLLAAILVPAMSAYRRRAMIEATKATIQRLEMGCRQYFQDFDDTYPPSQDSTYSAYRGSQLLALFLIGYGPNPAGNATATGRLDVDDGCDGPGFRLPSGGRAGKVYGPYGEAEKVSATGQRYNSSGQKVMMPRFFTDAFDQPILYYRFSAGYSGDNGVEATTASNDDAPTPGPSRGRTGATGGSEVIDDYARDFKSGGTHLRSDFLLISRGPDGLWCGSPYGRGACPASSSTGGAVSASDDVVNFFPNK